jgi:hypothetical protein
MGLTAKKALGASKKYTDDQIAQIPGGTVVDVVEDGNMNPVTSNAVYDEAQEIKLSISDLSASTLHKSWTLLNNGSYYNVGANANFSIDSPEETVYRTNPNNYSELRFDIFITDGQDPTTAKALSHHSFTMPFEIIHNYAISFNERDSIEIWRQIYFDSSDPNVDKSLDHCILTLKFYMDADSYFVWIMRGEPYCPNGYYNMKVYAR